MAWQRATGADRGHGAGQEGQTEESEVASKHDDPSGGADQHGRPELKELPAKPELSPIPAHLKN